MSSGIHPANGNKYVRNRRFFEMSDDAFKDFMIRKQYKQGKLSKEEAFLELI